MYVEAIHPSCACYLLVNQSFYSFIRPQAELSHVPNMILMEPDYLLSLENWI